MSVLVNGDLVVLDTPNPLYRGVVAVVIDVGNPWERGIDRKVIQIAIPARAVQIPGPPGHLIHERMRASHMTRIEDLIAAAGCEG